MGADAASGVRIPKGLPQSWGSSDNGSTAALQAAGQGSIPWFSTEISVSIQASLLQSPQSVKSVVALRYLNMALSSNG